MFKCLGLCFWVCFGVFGCGNVCVFRIGMILWCVLGCLNAEGESRVMSPQILNDLGIPVPPPPLLQLQSVHVHMVILIVFRLCCRNGIGSAGLEGGQGQSRKGSNTALHHITNNLTHASVMADDCMFAVTASPPADVQVCGCVCVIHCSLFCFSFQSLMLGVEFSISSTKPQKQKPPKYNKWFT